MPLKEKKSNAGRPTKYKPEYVEIARSVCAEHGATLEQLAKHFNVNTDTICEWKKVHPEFSEAILKGGEQHDTQKIVESLKKSAIGFDKRLQKLNKFGDVVDVFEEVPPNIQAAAMWLHNRDPNRWKAKQEIELSGEIKIAPALEIIDPNQK